MSDNGAAVEGKSRETAADIRLLKEAMGEALLCEVSWEVCQQVGGIYTVIRSKVPAMVKAWGRRYCLVGPYNEQTTPAEFQEAAPIGVFGTVAKTLQAAGIEAHYGYWLVTGRPRVVLLNPRCAFGRLGEIKYVIWERHGINMTGGDPLLDEVVAFGFLVEEFFKALAGQEAGRRVVIGHFHEWMGGTAIPAIRHSRLPVAMVFTTHATLLGRYKAMGDSAFYEHVPFMDWRSEARNFNVEPQVMLERAAAHGSHVFTTLSDITAFECEHLLGRKPDVLLPNGLNIQRFAALHEFQNLHRINKEKIHQFVMGHFFPTYTFDLDKSVYFFTSGRFEFGNKGFDLTIEALARLNWRMKQSGLDRTVVFFLVTRQPYRCINPDVMRSRALMEEVRKHCEAIKNQIGDRLFVAAAMGEWPRLDSLVDDYWRLRLRRTLHAWKTDRLPLIVTHNMEYDHADCVLSELRRCNLLNHREDPVKVVYHPEFISSSDPLFGMDYDQFVRGCHLGIFPSYYEPWGYAPMECAVMGIPSVSSDLSGFGNYVMQNVPDHDDKGLIVLHRRYASFGAAAEELTDWMFKIAQLERRDRIALRNRVENASEQFGWENIGRHYAEAHEIALRRVITAGDA